MTDPRMTDLVGAYVLGALEPEEMDRFERAMASDAALRAEVDEARGSLVQLAEALPDAAPPPELRARVLERARAVRPPSGAAGGDAGETTERASAEPPPASAREPKRGSSRPVATAMPWLLLAASLVGLFLLGRDRIALDAEVDRLASELDSAREALGASEIAVARLDSLRIAISGSNVHFATLSGDADPTLRLVWNRDAELLLVAAANLPALAPGRTFQLWGIRGADAPVSLGTFDTDPSGTAVVTLAVGGTDDYDVSAVTEEPAGGSPQPTSTPFLVGAWATQE